MFTKRRLAYLTVFVCLAALAFVSSGLPGSVLAQYYYSGGAAANNIVSCGYDHPAQSVAGAITVATGISFGPAANSVINGVVLQPGSKWLVTGMDKTKKWYKILIGCAIAWVPVGTIGPSPDAPLANYPLPTNIVSDSISTPN